MKTLIVKNITGNKNKKDANKSFDESTVIGKASHLTRGSTGTNAEKQFYFGPPNARNK